MTSVSSPQPISPLRARMIEDMTVRGFKDDTRRDYAWVDGGYANGKWVPAHYQGYAAQ